MGFDQSQTLEIIMQIHSSVNVHWMTLKITPTMAAKPPWSPADDVQRPHSHSSSEFTHFEFEKLKQGKKLPVGLKGEVTNCISPRKHWSEMPVS